MTNDHSASRESEVPFELADRYAELRGFRSEAFVKYRARELNILKGPPVSFTVPKVEFKSRVGAKKKIGPLSFYDTPPVLPFIEAFLRSQSNVKILEIGPGGGELAFDLTRRFGSRIDAYYGFDRDASVRGAFQKVESLADLPGGIDLVIASEVIEHMTADQLFANILKPLSEKLSQRATFVLSTPNPTSPGGIARDFTHVQNYPWYDLYAIFRLTFGRVEIFRAFYAYAVRQLVLLLPRFLVCAVLDMEWCNGLVCVASKPYFDRATELP